MKQCSSCHQIFSLSHFHKNRRSKSGYRSECRDCKRIKQRKWWKPSSRAASAVKHAAIKRAFLASILVDGYCVDCSECNILVLDFDHVDPSTKLHSVADLLANGGLPALKREVAKCVLRCANCHRIRTAHQFGSWRLELQKPEASSCTG